MSNILEQMLEASKEQLELQFEHKKELAQIKTCHNKEIKELKEKYKKKITDLEAKLAESNESHHKNIVELTKMATEKDRKIEELKQQLAEKEKSLSIKSVVRTLMKDNNLNCTFRDKTNAQIQQCGDVYNSNYGYFNFEDDYDESLNNKNDSRFDITSIDLTNQDKISFCIEQLEKVKEKILSYEDIYYQFLESGAKVPVFCVVNFRVGQQFDNQIKQLKEMK